MQQIENRNKNLDIINPTVWIITLNVNSLNMPVKNKLSE